MPLRPIPALRRVRILSSPMRLRTFGVARRAYPGATTPAKTGEFQTSFPRIADYADAISRTSGSEIRKKPVCELRNVGCKASSNANCGWRNVISRQGSIAEVFEPRFTDLQRQVLRLLGVPVRAYRCG